MAATEHRELVRRLERALARGSRLLAVTRGLQTALAPVDVAHVVTRHIRAAVGAFFTGIALVDEEARHLQYLSMDPLPELTARAWTTIPLDTDAPVAAVVRTGHASFLETVAEAEAHFPGIGPHMIGAGTRAMAHLPLIGSSGRAMGTLAVSFADPRRISPSEREFLTTLAGYTAQAMERALLYEQQRTVAEALQGAVLPTALPAIDGWEVDGRFQAAALGMQVGGDWYDAFTLPDGRLACAVGDATGHGLAAARVMSSVRHALRAYAVLGAGPAAVMTRLDEMLLQLEPESLATAVYLELDPAAGAGRFCVAGHLPMLRCHPDHGTSFVEVDPDPPLGCAGPRPRHEHSLQLDEGEVLLLYTDGLIERRHEELSTGLTRLAQTAAQARAAEPLPLSGRHLLDVIVDRMIAVGTIGDDVSAMTVHRHAAAR
ncbi:MAG: GAF domain-containing SpoIIE family protein phosphatase, partial [Kineosporiaceae bacterium]